MEMNQVQHVPVMLDRCVALLTPALENREEAVVVDATIGLGGHAEALLKKFPHLRLIGIDRDERALARSRERLSQLASRINFIHAVYDQIPTLLSGMGIKGVAGILFDLGVSSLQIDDFERGFSYSRSAPLDMRMDKSSALTASNVINDYSQEELSWLIKAYGEEKFANRIAKNIVKARESRKIENTDELVEIIKASIPAPARRLGGNPAKRTFQAIRIEVNQELEILKRAIPQAISCIELHGRMVVMSFQSLEDRIVKQAFADVTKSKSPVGLPIELKEHKAKFRLVFNGSETPDESEISRNPRSQSVRLRAIERIAI
jgi:16S rRNA (cytosine1402-N4)-methyltransferase